MGENACKGVNIDLCLAGNLNTTAASTDTLALRWHFSLIIV